MSPSGEWTTSSKATGMSIGGQSESVEIDKESKIRQGTALALAVWAALFLVQPRALTNYIRVAETGGKPLVMDQLLGDRAKKHSAQHGCDH